MNLIVSGAGGFLGKHLLKQLADDKSCRVIALSSNADQLVEFREVSNLIVMENQDFIESSPSLEHYTLINLAYVRSNEFDVVKASCEFTFELLKSCRNLGVKRIVNISSQSVYDSKRREAARETDLVKVDSLYDMGKYYLENWISDFGRSFNVDYVNLRIGSLVGPGFPQRITSRLVKQALEQGVITINMNGQVFSYTHVCDMARAIVAAASCRDRKFWNRALNIGTYESYSIDTIANTIRVAMNNNNLNLTIEKLESEPNEIVSSLDSSLFSSFTGWKAEYHLKDIIEEELGFRG